MPLSYATSPDGNQAYTVWVVLAGIIVAFIVGLVVGLRFGRNRGFRQLGAFELRDRVNRARIGGWRRN